jgi:hypothetical protein
LEEYFCVFAKKIKDGNSIWQTAEDSLSTIWALTLAKIELGFGIFGKVTFFGSCFSCWKNIC